MTTTPSPGSATGAKAGSIVLALNSGSSSLKFGLYRVDAVGSAILVNGEAEAIGEAGGGFHVEDACGARLVGEAGVFHGQREAVAHIGAFLAEADMPAPAVIGHRIVHGGPRLRQHRLIDEEVLSQLKAAVAFAPAHMPPALSVIEFAREHFPGVPQVACFDTAFHAQMPPVASVLPLPKALRDEGIERYGFHGLSCESILRQLGGELPGRLIIAHLGNGASVTAVKFGKSIDTSMGLTPSGGVIMGSRTGDLDPGVLVYLLREKGFDGAMLEDLVDHRSGLLGISGIDGDMRRLKAEPSNADAQLAIDMFRYSVRKEVAAMIAALGGIDLIVFTGGIGENDPQTRASVCAGLDWIGVSLDEGRNLSATNPLNDQGSRCTVQVLPSREDEQIARHAWALAPI